MLQAEEAAFIHQLVTDIMERATADVGSEAEQEQQVAELRELRDQKGCAGSVVVDV